MNLQASLFLEFTTFRKALATLDLRIPILCALDAQQIMFKVQSNLLKTKISL